LTILSAGFHSWSTRDVEMASVSCLFQISTMLL
jgi:hypothetical protein